MNTFLTMLILTALLCLALIFCYKMAEFLVDLSKDAEKRERENEEDDDLI